MAGIHRRSTANCSPVPAWKFSSRLTPPTRAAALKNMASVLASRSADAGVSATATAPTAGSKTASETAHWSQPLIASPLSSTACSEPRDDDGQDGHPDEQEHRVPLDVAGLHVPQEVPELTGDHADAVDGAVDH